MGVVSIRWEPLFRVTTCEEKYSYYQTIVDSLMEHCFPIKSVTRHTADKRWITDLFRNLIRKRQRAYKSGNRDEYRVLRNMVNREYTKLKFEFYQKHILAIRESGSRDWWKNMKKIMGLNGNSNSDMEELAKKTTDGDFAELANIINYFFLSVSDHLPRLEGCHRIHCLARNVFLLYVNDLESNVPLYKYVDDRTLFEICNTTDVSVMQESIDRAVNWTNNNCMTINSKNQRKWLFVLLQMKMLGILY